MLAFDRHPITLAAVHAQLQDPLAEALVATGERPGTRQRVEKLFARDSRERAIALCSDALNEGLNLQGAAAVIHLDLPTTLRVAEQRVGRVDRMDSPHHRITVWWPQDGKAFATRAIELLLARRQASESLLGSNLPIPAFADREETNVVQLDEHIRNVDRSDLTWDGVRDALDPVRHLVHGEDTLVSGDTYDEHRHTRQRVIARVAPVAADTPWAFLALAGTQHGAPRWLILEGASAQPTVGVQAVVDRLREHLREDPPNIAFDENCQQLLDRFLMAAARAETMLLPRRMQRALEQMDEITKAWGDQAAQRGAHDVADQWWGLRKIARLSSDDEDRLDPYLVGEVWWDLVRPLFAGVQRSRRHRRYIRLRDLDTLLLQEPLDLPTIQDRLGRVPVIEPVDRRVNAAIIGVPSDIMSRPTMQLDSSPVIES